MHTATKTPPTRTPELRLSKWTTDVEGQKQALFCDILCRSFIFTTKFGAKAEHDRKRIVFCHVYTYIYTTYIKVIVLSYVYINVDINTIQYKYVMILILIVSKIHIITSYVYISCMFKIIRCCSWHPSSKAKPQTKIEKPISR